MTLWRWQSDAFASPVLWGYLGLWLGAGVSGVTIFIVPSTGRVVRWWPLAPWVGAGVLLGFVVPGLFSFGGYVLLAGLLLALAAALKYPAWKGVLLTVVVAIAVTMGVLWLALVVGV